MKILMVCLGNICRSPLAEGILQYKLKQAGLNWIIESAGTNRIHTGQPPHPLSIKVAIKNGIDISMQRSRDFIAEDFNKYDKIYAMATDVMADIKNISGKNYDAKKVKLLLDELYPHKNKDVPDPWSGPFSGYEQVFELIDKACTVIVQHAKTNE